LYYDRDIFENLLTTFSINMMESDDFPGYMDADLYDSDPDYREYEDDELYPTDFDSASVSSVDSSETVFDEEYDVHVAETPEDDVSFDGACIDTGHSDLLLKRSKPRPIVK